MNATDREEYPGHLPHLVELKLMLPEDLCRAFQRCLWIQIHETGQTQLHLMEELVRDFLIKHGC